MSTDQTTCPLLSSSCYMVRQAWIISELALLLFIKCMAFSHYIRDNDIVVQRIKRQWLFMLGHVVRMDENYSALEVFHGTLSGVSRARHRPLTCWMHQGEKVLTSLGVWNYTKRRSGYNREAVPMAFKKRWRH